MQLLPPLPSIVKWSETSHFILITFHVLNGCDVSASVSRGCHVGGKVYSRSGDTPRFQDERTWKILDNVLNSVIFLLNWYRELRKVGVGVL